MPAWVPVGGRWQRWKEIERDRTLDPCPTCDTHIDAPLLSWRQGVHRTWCPTYGQKLVGAFASLLFIGVTAAITTAVLGPNRERYFDWRLFAWVLDMVVILLFFHLRARRARARSATTLG